MNIFLDTKQNCYFEKYNFLQIINWITKIRIFTKHESSVKKRIIRRNKIQEYELLTNYKNKIQKHKNLNYFWEIKYNPMHFSEIKYNTNRFLILQKLELFRDIKFKNTNLLKKEFLRNFFFTKTGII